MDNLQMDEKLARLRRCRREMDTLSDLLWALRRMAEEIRMARTPLPLLLERLSQGCGQEAGEFFQAVSAAARRGEDLGRTWRGAAEALPLPSRDSSRANTRIDRAKRRVFRIVPNSSIK